jgi:hypothetical protein
MPKKYTITEEQFVAFYQNTLGRMNMFTNLKREAESKQGHEEVVRFYQREIDEISDFLHDINVKFNYNF